jgi:hypothetical protein
MHVWQRNYWERILRSPQELDRARAYIRTNAVRWSLDPLHPAVE